MISGLRIDQRRGETPDFCGQISGLSEKFREACACDLWNFLSQRKGGNLEILAFLLGGDDWKEFLSSNPFYYPRTEDVEICSSGIPKSLAHHGSQTEVFYSLGSGGAQEVLSKDMRMIERLPRLREYWAIDGASELLPEAVSAAQSTLSDGITVRSAHIDFITGEPLGGGAVILTKGPFIAAEVGITASNLTGFPGCTAEEQTNEMASNIAQTISWITSTGSNGIFIFTTDANPDVEQVLFSYLGIPSHGTTHTPWQRMQLAPIKRARDIVNIRGNFNSACWEYKPIIRHFGYNYNIHHCLYPTQDQNGEIFFGGEWHEFSVRSGTELSGCNTVRKPVSDIINMVIPRVAEASRRSSKVKVELLDVVPRQGNRLHAFILGLTHLAPQ
jgi:hypothetical protein